MVVLCTSAVELTMGSVKYKVLCAYGKLRRIVDTGIDEVTPDEEQFENTLRPKDFANYIGQKTQAEPKTNS